MSQQKVPHERITLRIPQVLHEKAKEEAQAQHVSLNSFIVRAVERAAAQKGQQQ
ncbi:type II toxin-antitoxin system HicB family antitoxin [Acidovorax sp. LjRoot74]|uniref:YlcI/YnfO family protein n=1 Tax=Acidovorax sp. LjRoot74 TaxID=3342337 RepID=UPI003ECE5D64